MYSKLQISAKLKLYENFLKSKSGRPENKQPAELLNHQNEIAFNYRFDIEKKQ